MSKERVAPARRIMFAPTTTSYEQPTLEALFHAVNNPTNSLEAHEVSPTSSRGMMMDERPAIKRTMSRRGAIGFSGLQFLGPCDAASRASYFDSMEHRHPPERQLSHTSQMNLLTSPRKRCRIGREMSDPGLIVEEASAMLQMISMEGDNRAMRRRRTDSFTSTVSAHSAVSWAESEPLSGTSEHSIGSEVMEAN